MNGKSLITLKTFFSMLFKYTNGYIEIRPITHQGRVHDILFSKDIEELAQHCFQLRKKSNVYFGVTTRRNKGSGKKENVYEVTSLWADMDFKDYGGEKVLQGKLKAFSHQPSIIIHSGGGYHVYWLLKEPHRVEDIALVEGYTKGIAQYLKADACWDLSHVLRPPCTINHPNSRKRRHGRVQALVRMIHRSTKSNCLSDFDDFWTEVLHPKVADIDLSAIPKEVPPRFWELYNRNKKVKATWEGQRPDLKDQSRSGYDMSMSCKLAKMGFSSDEIAAVLIQMPSGKNKEANFPYLKITIGKALALADSKKS